MDNNNLEANVRRMVEEVIKNMNLNPNQAYSANNSSNNVGVFNDLNSAVVAAKQAFKELSLISLETRDKIIAKYTSALFLIFTASFPFRFI